ncbi:hypothetical protein Pla175_46700 [Pirellulimonas nuda]|uniref:Uncharacterized protein n=1 Tax=Pirellulimonas nuda TaxID=2528009 RepID=A0A518DIE8_9BACT|nr:hypothetical protein [Pirellulimonas nuda]QDU91250.1 hypothetical protein Pla175_46700 [Pirellulimonas nuda]
MPFRYLVAWGLLLLMAPAVADQPRLSDEALADQVDRLVGRLESDESLVRDGAQQELLELAGDTWQSGDRLLAALPHPDPAMPVALREAVAGLRSKISKHIADTALKASRVSLDLFKTPLADVFKQIEQQTGNRLLDYREQFGQDAQPRPITLTVKDKPFWEAMDAVLDQGELGVYAYAGESALAVVNREPDDGPRRGAACYAGPLRFEATQVVASRSLRKPNQRSLDVKVEIAWEPRLEPIAISQQMSDVEARSEGGVALSLLRPEQEINLETQQGTQSVEVSLPLVLPERKTEKIASLKGKVNVLAPGRRATFRFEGLDAIKQPAEQQQGGVSVTLNRMVQNGVIWELHMRLKVSGAGDALASHRGWVFQNPSHLENAKGEVIEHAGFETTMQTQDEVGLAYLFELEDGPKDLTWVYETPASIVEFPVEWELGGIELP